MKIKIFTIILFSLNCILTTNAQTAQKQTKSGSNVKIMYDNERQFYYISDNESGKLIKLLPYKTVHDFKEGLALVETDKNIGFINEQGVEIIPPDGKYQWGHDFSDGMAVVGTKNESGWRNAAGYINKSGSLVIPLTFQEAKDFSENLAPAKKDEKWGFIDKSGKTVIPFDYAETYIFSCGLAVVRNDEQKIGFTFMKYGYVDKNGKIILPINYVSATEFHQSHSGAIALVQDKDYKYQLIDDKGNKTVNFEHNYNSAYWRSATELNLGYYYSDRLIRYGIYNIENKNFTVKPEYVDLLKSHENYYLVLTKEQKKGVCSVDEKIPAIYSYIFDQDNLYYAILGGTQTKTGISGGKYVLYDYSGKKLTKYDDKDSYDEITPFYEGFARVKRNGKYGYIDSKGNEIIPLEYEYAGVFSSGVAAVSNGEKKAGAINKKNQVVVPFEYENLGNFVDGVSFYKQDSLYGLINNKGEKITKPIFKGIGNFSEGLAPFMKDGKIGYLNTKGEIVIQAEYDTGNPFSEGCAMVSKDKKAGYIDKKGTLIIPLKYDNGREFKDGYTLVIEGNKYFLLDKKGNIAKTY